MEEVDTLQQSMEFVEKRHSESVVAFLSVYATLVLFCFAHTVEDTCNNYMLFIHAIHVLPIYTGIIWYRTTLNEADLTQATGYLQVFTDTLQEGLPRFCVRHDMFLESHQSHISIYQMQFHFRSLLANLSHIFSEILKIKLYGLVVFVSFRFGSFAGGPVG